MADIRQHLERSRVLDTTPFIREDALLVTWERAKSSNNVRCEWDGAKAVVLRGIDVSLHFSTQNLQGSLIKINSVPLQRDEFVESESGMNRSEH